MLPGVNVYDAGAKALANARAHGYATTEEYVSAVYAESAQRGKENRKAFRKYEREERQKAGGWAGWNYAGYLFAPKSTYLHDEDNVLDWLYKARALIGAAVVILAGVHYHQSTMSFKGISASFPAIFGVIRWPLILTVFSVVPVTAAVVLFTKPGKRKVAFKQMLRYPVTALFISLAAYGFVRVYFYLYYDSTINTFVKIVLAVVVGSLLLRYFLFWFRSIYILTVGMCRLGDGHPLLPPIIGTFIVWIVALSDYQISPDEPALIAHAILLGGPVSVTALGIVEILRLRKKYPDDFPFLNGPLPTNSRHPANPRYPGTRYQFKPTSRNWIRLWYRYRLPFAILSAIVLLILVTVYSLDHSSSPGPATATQPATITIRPDYYGYSLGGGVPDPAGNYGDLTGTPDGVRLARAIGMPLPRDVTGSYQSCALNLTSNQRWHVGYVIPWKQFTRGRQFCLQTEANGLQVSLLTVESASADKEVTFSVATWTCASTREPGIC